MARAGAPRARGRWSQRAAAVTLAALVATLGSLSSASARPDKSRIRAVDHREAGAVAGTMQIRIRGTQEPTFTVYKLDYPARVVVDITGAELDRKLTGESDHKASWPVNGWAVNQLSVYELHDVAGDGASQGGHSLVRVVVGMARPGTYHAEARGRDVMVTVTPQEAQPAGVAPGQIEAATKAVEQAEARRSAVLAEAEAAERRKRAAEGERERLAKALAQAEQARSDARSQAQEAERRAAQARELREREEAAYREIADARREAEQRAEQARELREREEAAYRQATVARREAERRSAEIGAADDKLNALQSAAAEARAEVESLRRAAAEAERRAAGMRERKDSTEREIARAKAEAERQAGALRDAERTLSAHKREISSQEREVARLSKVRGEAERALRDLDSAAKKARAAREAEEAQLATLSQRRDHLEGELATARSAIREAQASWKAQRSEAEAQLNQLGRAVDNARAERLAEEKRLSELAARRKQLEGEIDRIRQEHERDGKSSSRRAAAEMRALDSARVAEEKRIAELATRRKQLERELQQARAKVRVAAQAEHKAQRSEADAEREALAKAVAAAKQQRAEEADKIAELGKRRSALEASLASIHAQVEAAENSRAQAERARRAEEAKLAELSERRKTVESDLAERQRAADAKASKRKLAKAKAASKVRVEEVDFVDADEVARVVIALSDRADPKVVRAEGKRVVLEIDDVTLPSKLERTLDTSAYRGPIRAVSSYRSPDDADKMRLVVDLAYPAKHALKRSGNSLLWDFAKSAKRERQAARTQSARKRRPSGSARAQSIPAPVVGGYGAASTPITQKTVAQLANQRRRVYRGTKIDLDLQNVDIHNVMRLLADVGGINIVVPDEVSAEVTVRLRQVPWDQALEVILASKGLWYRREGNLYRIATRKQLDAEAEAEAERIAALIKAEAPEPQIFTLNYAVASQLKPQLEALLSPKGRIEIDERTNSLIINDVRAHRTRIIDLLTRLDTQTPQIQIEARIVEARSTFAREFGVQWGGSLLDANTGLVFPGNYGVVGGNTDSQTVGTGVAAASPDFAVNLPAATGTGAGGALGFAFGSVGGGLNLTLRLSALEDTGTVRIISAPKITVLNNVEAEISQGVSIPISVISANGVQTQFVQADLSLEVTPHVSQRDCSIAMDLQIQKNEADFVNTGARGDPTILRKEASTTVLVADNETTVIGGIYTRNSGLSYSKVPFLGDLPLLGWLFKNRRENDERTEVLVFITPRITNKAFLRCE
ncbi:type IV pilus secretin family protein [Haliangium ochraceum]|nr:type IV pilus secretin family protein [Haliangium ochraceum]